MNIATLDSLGQAEMDIILDVQNAAKHFSKNTAYIFAIGADCDDEREITGGLQYGSPDNQTMLNLFGMMFQDDSLSIAALSGIEDVIADLSRSKKVKNFIIQIMETLVERCNNNYYD